MVLQGMEPGQTLGHEFMGTIETYIKDAQKANKSDLVEIWQTIKNDRKKHMHFT